MRSLRSIFAPAAIIAAAALVLVPTLARADEATPVAPAPATRPLGMHDLDARSSLGLRADYGRADGESFDDPFEVGQVVLDGELALGQHAKLFAAVPFGFALIRDDLNFEALGNLTVGIMTMGRLGRVTGGLGGSVSAGGDYEASKAVLLHDDVASYFDDATVLHGFGTVRGESQDVYFQGQLGYLHYEGDDAGYPLRFDGVQMKLGAGARLPGDLWLLAEVGFLRELHFHGEGTRPDEDYFGQLGVRRHITGTRMSWAARASVARVYTTLTMSLGAELRADWL